MKQSTLLRASEQPQESLRMVAYEGQPDHMKMYREGYEKYMNTMPALSDDDPLLEEKVEFTKALMHHLGKEVSNTPTWIYTDMPDTGGFDRTILAMEEPITRYSGQLPFVTEGSEIVVARWGEGFTSPVHGHPPGYLFEEILYGKIRENVYRVVDETRRIARPLVTRILEKGVMESYYTKRTEGFRWASFIHNFVALTKAATLHYFAEHSRDGRGNTLEVEYFEQFIDLTNAVKPVTSIETHYSHKGDVVMVRSMNVPEYGDHFIVVTGPPVMKPHGLRPQEVSIQAPLSKSIIDKHDDGRGLVLLKLDDEATRLFHEFHGITMRDGEVIFPNK